MASLLGVASAKLQPRLNILDGCLLVSSLVVSNQSYEKTRIGEGIMAIVCKCLECFEEARQGLVDGLKSSTPGRDWKWCKRAVQGKEFVATIGLHSSRLWGFEYKWENILHNHYSTLTRCYRRCGLWTFRKRNFVVFSRLNSRGFRSFQGVKKVLCQHRIH